MRFQHKYGLVSTLLKLLAVLSIIVAALNIDAILFAIKVIPYLNKIEGPLGPHYVISLWFFIGFLLCIVAAGILDKPKFLYLFPLFAYLHLIKNLCWLFMLLLPSASISGPHITFDNPKLDPRTFSYIAMLLIGLFTLATWHKTTRKWIISKKVERNLKIIAIASYIVLILNCVILYKDYYYYLQKALDSIPLALYFGGIRDIVGFIIIIIFCLKKWPSILWLFPIMLLNYLWLGRLTQDPSSLSMLNLYFMYASLFLATVGLVTLSIWIYENRYY